MLKQLIKKVMAFTANQIIVGNKIQPINTNVLASENDLTLQELEFLLSILKDTTLKGHQIEVFYNLIIKIQNQYIKQNNS
jgi:hypothetical protein